jgi:DNA-binding XRE family transcriptional regulator
MDKNDYSKIIEILAELPLTVVGRRRDRGISQRDAAKEIGINLQTINRFEKNGKCSIDSLLRILNWLATVHESENTRDAHRSTIHDVRTAWVAKEINLLVAIQQVRLLEPTADLRGVIQFLHDGVTPPTTSE